MEIAAPRRLSPGDIALLASMNIADVPVARSEEHTSELQSPM